MNFLSFFAQWISDRDQPVLFIFVREQKCLNNHSGLGFCAGMVVINTPFVLKKFLIIVFPLKTFSWLKIFFRRVQVDIVSRGSSTRSQTTFFNHLSINWLQKRPAAGDFSLFLFFSFLFSFFLLVVLKPPSLAGLRWISS